MPAVRLLKIFELDWDYLLQRHSHTFEQAYPNSMGPHSLPFVWATVFAFRKTNRSQQKKNFESKNDYQITALFDRYFSKIEKICPKL